MADVTNEIMTNDKTKILSGESLNFYTPRSQRIRSLKVYFSPKQEGSGTPSPENVRPISGWTGVEVNHCGKNLISTDITDYKKITTAALPDDFYMGNGEFSGTVNQGSRDVAVFRSNYALPPGTYRLSYDYINNTENSYWRPIIAPQEDSTSWYSYSVITGTPTAPDSSGHISISFTAAASFNIVLDLNCFGNSTGTVVNKIYNMQLEIGAEETNYVPYKTNLLLPKEYQEVEYLESTGTQWINTGIVGNESNVISARFSVQNIEQTTAVRNYIVGGRKNNSQSRTQFSYSYNLFFGWGRITYYKTKEINRNIHEITVNETGVVCDGEQLFERSPAETEYDHDDSLIALFCVNNNNGTVNNIADGVKIYHVKIERNGAELINLIPCYRKSDKVAGMYDAVSGQFYTNSGTGEFITGPAVNRYDIDWSEDVGTVYGGYVDLVSGELVETWTDLLELQEPYLYANQLCFNVKDTNSTLPNETNINLYDWIIDSFNTERGNNRAVGLNAKNHFVYATNAVLLNLGLEPPYIEENGTKVLNPWWTEWYESLNEPPKLTATKREFTTHQLSPTTLSTLMFDNNFWSNADRIEIEYDYIGIFDAIESRKNIFTATPHLETLSGMNMTFNTDMVRELKKCIINFSPIQLGTGDPSPDNIREIYGRSEIGVGLSNENLLPKDPPTAKIYHRTTGGSGGTWASASAAVVCAIIPMPYGATIFLQKNSTGHSGTINLGRHTVINVGDRYYQNSGFTNFVNVAKAAVDALEYYVNFYSSRLASFNASWTDYDFMISYGTTRKTYIPPMGTILNMDFPEEIYGGYMDVLTGELWRTWRYIPLSNLTWSYNKSWKRFESSYLTSATRAVYGQQNVYCDIYKAFPNTTGEDFYASGNYAITFNSSSPSNPYLIINDSRYTTKDDFVANLTGNIAYKLKTPQLVTTLEPQVIRTLQGINNIWSNANGDLEIAYWKHNDDAYQHVPSSPITSNDNFIIVTDDGYAIGEEDDFIVY